MILAIDNFIKDQRLLKDIASDPTFFKDPGVYYWWNGWWNSEPRTVKQRLIDYIWADNCPINTKYSLSGFEYWTGIQTANPDMGFNNNLSGHYDKDEELFEQTGQIVRPIIGTVYYPEQEEFEGGMLEIYTKGVDKAPEMIYAKPNRLIIFDAGKHIHTVTPVTSGTRKAIAINLWQSEPLSKQNGTMCVEQ
jgi:hypothetical protein